MSFYHVWNGHPFAKQRSDCTIIRQHFHKKLSILRKKFYPGRNSLLQACQGQADCVELLLLENFTFYGKPSSGLDIKIFIQRNITFLVNILLIQSSFFFIWSLSSCISTPSSSSVYYRTHVVFKFLSSKRILSSIVDPKHMRK